MSQDNAAVTRLRLIADDLETLAGIVEQKALSRDADIATQLKRIHEAIVAELEQVEAALATFVTSTGPRSISFVVQDPENARTFAGRGTKSFGAWQNTTSQTFTISRVSGLADVDDYAFNVYVSASSTDLSTGTDVLVATVTCSTNGTSCFTGQATGLSATVAPGQWIIWEHSSGAAESLSVTVEGAYA